MRKALIVALVCLSSFFAQASTTISANLKSLGTAVVATRSFVRFELVNCGSGVPRVIGAGVIPMKAIDLRPDASGIISGTLYSNTQIDCAGAFNTRYRVTVFYDGINNFPPQEFLITGTSWNLNSASVYNPPPVGVAVNPIWGIRPQGAWLIGTAYNPYDVVSYAGSSYVALLASTGVTPGTDATKWMLLASIGNTGATGSTGATGATGTIGSNTGFNTTKVVAPSNPASTDLAVWADSTTGVLTVKDSTGANAAPAGRTRDKGFVNAVTDCGAVGDGVTDDGATINTCIANNPGKIILLPKMRTTPCSSGSGGGCVGTTDYYSTVQITGFQNSGGLIGGGTTFWSMGGVRIRFAASVGGILILNGNSVRIENLSLRSDSTCWSPSTFPTWTPPTSTMMSGDGANGITLAGSLAIIRNVSVSCFEGNGIAVMGNNSIASQGQPDQFTISNAMIDANRGYGVLMRGVDSQAGKTASIQCYGNQLGCIGDYSQTGNYHDSPVSQGDAQSTITVAGTTQAVTSAAVSSGVLTTTTTATPTNGTQTVGNYVVIEGASVTGATTQVVTLNIVTANLGVATLAIAPDASLNVGGYVTLAGQADSSFDGTFQITALSTAPNTVTYFTTHASGSTTGGTAATGINQVCRVTSVNTGAKTIACATSSQNMAATGGTIRTATSEEVYDWYYSNYTWAAGSFSSADYSNQSVFMNLYAESTSRRPRLGSGSMFIGRDSFNSGRDRSWGGIYGRTGNSLGINSGQGLFIENKSDRSAALNLDSGLTAANSGTFNITDRGTSKFCIQKASTNNISILNNCSAADARILITNSTGAMDIAPKSGAALRIVGGTSDVAFTGTDFTADATISSAGLGTFNGGVKAGASGSTISDSRELVQNAHSCGTTTTCANTANGSNRIVFGTVPLTSGTPSTATVTGMTAFTSTSSYVCTVTNATNAANNLLKVANASTTSFVITGPNTLTDTINYICIGN